MFNEAVHVKSIGEEVKWDHYFVTADYGTQNPMTFGLYGATGKRIHLIRRYYYSGRETGTQKTDRQYGDDFEEWLGNTPIEFVAIDPSAASFIAELNDRKDNRGNNKYRIIRAKNDVHAGIIEVSKLLATRHFTFDPECKEDIQEFYAYLWDEKAVLKGKEEPLKENDHCMDRNRYAVLTYKKMYPQYFMDPMENKRNVYKTKPKGARR